MTSLPTHRPPTHPGEMLREEFMKPLGITQEQLADRIGVTFQTVSRLVNRHQGVSAGMAARLSRLLGTTPEFWMDLQRDWDVWHELRLSRTELERIRPLPSAKVQRAASTSSRPARTGSGGTQRRLATGRHRPGRRRKTRTPR